MHSLVPEEQLGGAWIKLGQMLALRFDLLPAAYCDELFKLLNEVRPFAYAQVREIVRAELGAPPEALFRSFAQQPFAAASIGQVHRAVLPSGERVAVKVQRPGVRQAMQTDIGLMYSLARVLDWTHVFGATRSRAVVEPLTADPSILREDRLGTLMLMGQQVWPGGSVTALFAPSVTPSTLPIANPPPRRSHGSSSTARKAPMRFGSRMPVTTTTLRPSSGTTSLASQRPTPTLSPLRSVGTLT